MKRFPDREKPIREALAGVALTPDEERVIQWLGRWDNLVIDTIAGLLARVRGVPHARA